MKIIHEIPIIDDEHIAQLTKVQLTRYKDECLKKVK